MVRGIGLLLAVGLVGGVARGQGTLPSSAASQEILEVLAEPLAATAFKEPLPERYADWTEQQKKVAPHQIAGWCVVLWTMMNDAGRVPLLPPALENEVPKLVTDVCVSGKMPADWPGRPSALAGAASILQRSTELGLALHLPPSLAD